METQTEFPTHKTLEDSLHYIFDVIKAQNDFLYIKQIFWKIICNICQELGHIRDG